MCAEDRGDGKVQMTPCKKGIKPQVRTVDLQNLARVNRIWPTAVAGKEGSNEIIQFNAMSEMSTVKNTEF